MDFLSSRARLICIVVIAVLVAAAGSTGFVSAKAGQNRARQSAAPKTGTEDRGPKNSDLELLPVQGNISMLAGAGGNITVQAGRDGSLLVDTGLCIYSMTVP